MKREHVELADMWARHSAEWRDTAQIVSQWREAANTDLGLLESRATGDWWDTVGRLGVTLLITREYEHLIIAASVHDGRPRLSFQPVPHPSGIAVDREQGRVYVASTRNPNQVFVFKPAITHLERGDLKAPMLDGAPLAPVSSAYYPGSLYMHDLALVGGRLCANAVGQNAVVRLTPEGGFERVWWPRFIDHTGPIAFQKNYIQLNSIAAGGTLRQSFFSASSASIGRRRPGHLDYPVDRRGVIFSGRTREPVCTGLTRPHSARLSGGKIWVANSGYGEIGYVRNGKLEAVTVLPGWTRGLCVIQDVAFVATSRVIPKFARYAPGLKPATSRCAVHAVSTRTGALLGSLEWPHGNQVFAIDWISAAATYGFLFQAGSRGRKQTVAFYYTYVSG